MNRYLNIDRLEFLVTKKCSGMCKHCSVIFEEENPDNSYKDFEKVKSVMKFLLDNFKIKSIMTYGGEPLLYSEITSKIHEIGKNHGVEKRELITNGYFSKKREIICSVVKNIIDSGVNDLKLSIDAFHQEMIPLEYVEIFIENIIISKFENIKIHPAWVVSQDFDNIYNKKTKEIIEQISKYQLKISNGNNIVPSGFAKKNLRSFYAKENLNLNAQCGEIAFTNALNNIKSLRILPNGNVNICRGLIIGNIFNENIDDIIKGYNPYNNIIMSKMLEGGLMKLIQFAEEGRSKIDVNDYYSSCDLCTDCIKIINNSNFLHGRKW